MKLLSLNPHEARTVTAIADPLYGGNRDKLGWRVLGHPGVYLENSAEENLSPEQATKGGVIQSLADLSLMIHKGHEDKALHSNANSPANGIGPYDLRDPVG